MPVGGARPGGGRKKGGQNKRTQAMREVADKALSSGRTPLDVMLGNMRFYDEQAKRLLEWIMMQGKGEKTKVELIEAMKTMCDFVDKSQSAASDCAPYVHARMSSIQMKVEKRISYAEILGTMTLQQSSELYSDMIREELRIEHHPLDEERTSTQDR